MDAFFRWLAPLVAACLVAAPVAATARPLRIAFINPTAEQTNPSFEEFVWWRRVEAIAGDAAADLGVEFDHYEPGYWPTELTGFVRKLVAGPRRPDYLIVTIHRGVGVELLKIAEAAHIPVLVLDSGLLPKDRARYGGPGEQLKYWIGSLLPENEAAGHDLALLLFHHAEAQGAGKTRPLQVVALGGLARDPAQVERTAGLRRAVREKGADLLQEVPAEWSREEARRRTARLLIRYPNIDVIWAAGDPMALGALDAVRASGRRPGVDIAIGGIDWSPEAIEAVHAGEMVATVGGHFLQGAWAVVMLYDDAHGYKLKPGEYTFRMWPITHSNVEEYAPRVNQDWSKVDFSRYSRARTPTPLRHPSQLPGLEPPAALREGQRP